MDIVGNGFLAKNLTPIAEKHPGVVVAAFGVSVASGIREQDFDREASLLYKVIKRCERNNEKLVFFSTASSALYAVPGLPAREDAPVFPSNAYGRHNLALEAVLSASPVDHLILRLAHVVGPSQPSQHLVPGLIRQIRSGEVQIYRDARRDLIDVRELVFAVDVLLASDIRHRVVNVASGTNVPVEAIVQHIESILGVHASKRYVSGRQGQSISVERLHQLAPKLADYTSSPDYYKRVINRHIFEPNEVDFT